jgi:hypothetical protein
MHCATHLTAGHIIKSGIPGRLAETVAFRNRTVQGICSFYVDSFGFNGFIVTYLVSPAFIPHVP